MLLTYIVRAIIIMSAVHTYMLCRRLASQGDWLHAGASLELVAVGKKRTLQSFYVPPLLCSHSTTVLCLSMMEECPLCYCL
jgi:hypothetical protein